MAIVANLKREGLIGKSEKPETRFQYSSRWESSSGLRKNDEDVMPRQSGDITKGQERAGTIHHGHCSQVIRVIRSSPFSPQSGLIDLTCFHNSCKQPSL